MNILRSAVAFASLAVVATSCVMDHAPAGLRRTPDGPGATVRYDLGHRPLPEIPLPTDTATWPDPTSRTGLRINASLIAPTAIERGARKRFSEMEGWGTFAPISVAFDIDHADPEYAAYHGPALDLANVKKRHQGDDYDFANDAVYLVNLKTGVPLVLDLGNGSFNYILKKLDKYWPNDTRRSERNLIFETIDETRGGTLAPELFKPEDDSDFDGTLDVPNLFGADPTKICPAPDDVCDNPASPPEEYESAECYAKRRGRDQCVADNLMYWYERETDSLILRPLLPMDEMTRYAVVITDRLLDGKGHPVRSPFEYVYHVTMEPGAQRVMDVINDPSKASYFGDIAKTGLDHVAFTWTFTTQPTVDDMKRLRDGLYGQGPFARWAEQFPAKIELQRAVGLTAGLEDGATDVPGWQTSTDGTNAGCPGKIGNMYVVPYEGIKHRMKQLIVEGFEIDDGPGVQALLRGFDHVDKMIIGTFKTPFLLEGGPQSADPNSAFHLNYTTGEGEVTEDEVQFWLIIPKATSEHQQPFNVNIYGHGYTGNFVEQILYAGNMAEHGLATIGINAMGHGLAFDNATAELATKAVLGGTCVAPFYDAITRARARDLNRDGIADSGGDFWSSYLFHTRDGVRQSILDHLQLVRILRAFGTGNGQMICRNEKTGWANPGTEPCDVNGDGEAELNGDFDADGIPDIGGASAVYGTWGESLGGILSAIHGSIDAYVTAAVPGSGGGGLTDIGIRSFQGGVVEAVLLRIWGPLVVSVPASERPVCKVDSKEKDHCTLCDPDQISLRWVMPDLNGTGEAEIACLAPGDIEDTTVFVENKSNGELRCARVEGPNSASSKQYRMRIGIPASIDDQVEVRFYPGRDMVKSYKTCEPLYAEGTLPKTAVTTWGKGRYGNGSKNDIESETCTSPTCTTFQGRFFGEGTPLTAPAEGYGQIRQTPSLRRFIQLAQMALDPGDPISFAPYYSVKQMTDPYGHPIAPHAMLTLNTIGDMNVPLNSGIDFARANGALPFLRPEQGALYPEYANYATPEGLYSALGKTPNQALIDNHVIEGITALGRHPATGECAASANAAFPDGEFKLVEGGTTACFPTGCTAETEGNPDTRKCYSGSHCDEGQGRCVPNQLGQNKCDEALFDADDLDEGSARYFEQNLPVPLRLARYTQNATSASIDEVWAPRLGGVPHSADGGWVPDQRPLTALLNAYVIPEGQHCFENGDPCQSFDFGTYLTNLTARFFITNGEDVYYLSHPKTHLCLGTDVYQCGYLQP